MACTSCASECLCSVVSGDSVIGVTGVGSSLVPYTITADICAGLAAITDGERDVAPTDLAVVINGSGDCVLVSIPNVSDCVLPLGGTTNQFLMKDSATDCDTSFKTPPYVRVTNVTLTTLTSAVTGITVSFDETVVDPLAMHDDITDNERLTVPVGWDGFWGFGANVFFDGGDPDDPVTVKLIVNGVQKARVDGVIGAASTAWISVSTEAPLIGADIIEVEVIWTGAGACDIGADSTFWAAWRSP